ncbi:sigma-70 family RNA polymerase sigma factor [Paenibacillus sp. SN-8-1]|uniref:sigma-70 family RNA polymerase sigma factor n=1 Tax=Paenibacillus sp. SN-8-1 TaxID=3435409 RepID=UPI003D9A928D
MEDIEIHPWLIRMSQGDEEAFQIIYELTKDHAYRLIYYLAPDKQDVGDLMSEVYMELLKSLDNYQQDQKFRSWFNGLIIRQVRNWQRKSWFRFRIMEKIKSITFDMTDRDSERRTTVLYSRMELLPILESLPLKLKEVIVLRYYQDCSLGEISALLKVPLGTVKSRHHHALKHMRKHFKIQDQKKEMNRYVHGKSAQK